MVKVLKLHDDSRVSGDMIGIGNVTGGDSLVSLTGTETLTNKTITAPVLGGTVTGTYTLAGTPTITNPTITTPNIGVATATTVNKVTITAPATAATLTIIDGTTLTGPAATDTLVGRASTDTLTNKTLTSPTMTGGSLTGETDALRKVSTATFTATSGDTGTTLTNITGLTGFTLVAGATYAFKVHLGTVCTTNGGISVAFKLTTTTLTSIECSATTFAAASMANARSTTAADQTKYVDNKAAAWLNVILEGSMVVNAGGTIAVQAAQNTGHADATSVFLGSYAEFRRIS